MILPGHLSAGYLIAKTVLAYHPEISGFQATHLALVGTFFGFAPDLDLIYHFIKARSFRFDERDSHRHYITHTPFFWIMLGLLVYIFTGNNILALIISLASLSHIFFDSFGSGNGMMYFWPLSKRKFSFLEYKEQEIKGDNLFSYYSNLVKIYSKNLTFWLEIFITIAAFFVFLK